MCASGAVNSSSRTRSSTPRGGNVLLSDARAHLAGERFAGVDLNVDVKHPGFETRLLNDLRGAELLERLAWAGDGCGCERFTDHALGSRPVWAGYGAEQ
jgi:hypothetical protein